jgi:dTDP-4-amino-4,6-dideoxygalactose transaminase
MDHIIDIARRHQVRVIEDNSHAHGSLYNGKHTGTIGDIGAMSLMTGKGFAIGEAGIITTNDRELYERCIAYAHYERTGVASRFNLVDNQITDADLRKFAGIPIGAMKGRMNQTCSAMGLVQLRYFPKRIQEIQEAINYFWEIMGETPGLYPHRISKSEGTMGCWYYPQALYKAEELNGTSSETFSRAINAEGVHWCFPGGNSPLHIHPYFHESDIFHLGRPTSIAFGNQDMRQGPGTLPVSEKIHEITIAIPWFKKCIKRDIKIYADAFSKVAEYFHTIH